MDDDSKEDTPIGIIDRIDGGLAPYYDEQGASYAHEFKLFCEESEFYDADIPSELTANIDNCSLLDFDDDFPIPNKEQLSKEQADEKMLKVLRACATINRETTFDWKKDDIQVKALLDKLAKQLPVLYERSNFDTQIWQALAYASNPTNSTLNEHFLSDMIDMFSWEFINRESNLKVRAWCDNNWYIKSLEQQQGPIRLMLRDAFSTYSVRTLPLLNGSRLGFLINDSAEMICKYALQAASLHAKLLKKSQITPPFAIDFMIAVRDIKKDDTKELEYYEDEDDDDHFSPYGEEKIPKPKPPPKPKIPAMKQVIDLIRANDGERHVYHEVLVSKDGAAQPRELMGVFQTFQKELQERNNGKYEDFPHGRRFQVLIDRRQGDEVIMFEADRRVDVLPPHHVQEWFVEANMTSMLPLSTTQEITAVTCGDLDGGLIGFSFQVNQGEDIRCAILLGGQTIRIQGKQLGQLYETLFVMDEDNTKYLQSDEFTELCDQFDEYVPQARFDQFCRLYGSP